MSWNALKCLTCTDAGNLVGAVAPCCAGFATARGNGWGNACRQWPSAALRSLDGADPLLEPGYSLGVSSRVGGVLLSKPLHPKGDVGARGSSQRER